MVFYGPVEGQVINVTMFEDRNETYARYYESETESDAELDIQVILESCPRLLANLRSAQLTHIEERVIDESLLSRLTNSCSLEEINDESRFRLRKRQKALSPYLGSILACVFIRVPGGHYTIEIDPVDRLVVHWEWQQT